MYFSQKFLQKVSGMAASKKDTYILCGELACFDIKEQNQLVVKIKEEYSAILCADLLCLERNIYFPSFLFYGTLVCSKIGFLKYREFIQNGALMGFLYRQFGVERSAVQHCMGGAIGLVYKELK